MIMVAEERPNNDNANNSQGRIPIGAPQIKRECDLFAKV
jgi:hypothetical protein